MALRVGLEEKITFFERRDARTHVTQQVKAGQLRVTELLTLRGAGGQPSKVGGELAADLAIHPDHRRDDGETVGLVQQSLHEVHTIWAQPEMRSM